MPSQIQTTTVEDLEGAILTVIRSIEPTHSMHREKGWTPAEDNVQPEGESQVPRLFAVEVMDDGGVEGGATGGRAHEVKILLDVLVNYGPFGRRFGPVISSDVWDVHDALTNAINTIPGLTFVERDGRPETDEGDWYVLPFVARYMRARRR